MKNALLATLVGLVAVSANAEFVSADDAAQAVARGARVVDVRGAAAYSAGHLPGAVLIDATAALTDRASLQALVSRQGVDLSREVVVVGEPGDVLAQRLQAHLKAYATGHVSWLVGGVTEWTLSGRALSAQAVALPAVPQFLVPLQTQGLAPRMAGAALRDTVSPSPVLPPGRPKAKCGPLGGQRPTRSGGAWGLVFAAGPSQGEMRPPWGAATHTKWGSVGAGF